MLFYKTKGGTEIQFPMEPMPPGNHSDARQSEQ